MSSLSVPVFLSVASLCLILAVTSSSGAAPFLSENKKNLDVKPLAAPVGGLSGSKKQHVGMPAKRDKSALYTIKAGDNLFKILIREYGLTNRQAEKFIEVVTRENNISNFRRLRIGQKISVSTLFRKNTAGSLSMVRKSGHSNVPPPSQVNPLQAPVQALVLEKPSVPTLQASDIAVNVKQAWQKIVPVASGQKRVVSTNSDRVDVVLDPVKYPILTAMDGGRILVDAEGKIPPSIKTILIGANSDLRVISNAAASPKQFLSSLIDAGKFYSVSEDFVMEFGSDPKLTVRSDFRVEKTAESIVQQDVILMNAGKVALSPYLTAFLKKEGFTVYEPFVLASPHVFSPRNRLVRVTERAPLDIASAILNALSIVAENNARITTTDVDNSGISISIMPDRYFQYKGKAYCIRYVKDSSVDNSLASILEARGVRSIVLDQNDDFRKISERILTSVGLPGMYGFHKLWPEEDAGYSIQMSGIMIDGAGASGESLFLTDREIDRIIRDISIENGFVVRN